MSTPRNYNCILCSKRPKTRDRRKLIGPNNKSLRKCLQQKFFIEHDKINHANSVICNKCRIRCSREIDTNVRCPIQTTISESINDDTEYVPPAKYARCHPCKSPPSIALPIPSAGGGHSQCVVCKRRGPKLVVVPTNARFNIFLDKLIILTVGARCCPGHLCNDIFLPDALDRISHSQSSSIFNRTDLMDLITQIRDMALRGSKRRIDFDTENALTSSDILNLTGLSKENFNDLCSIVQKDSVRRAIASARKYLSENFVPSNLGFNHISREEVITSHTRPLAQSLFGKGMYPAIIVADGTYIYIQKSSQFKFQRKCFSMHKHRPLVKPMVFVTTSGYIISVIGPYFSDGKNNDAQIMKHIIQHDIEEFKEWVTEDDIMIVDRGFRDALDLLQEMVEDSNVTRLVTKIRWVVESVNGRIKSWKYLDRVLPNSQIPFVSDYVNIACAIMNKYWPELNTGDLEQDEQLASKMLYLSKQKNLLHEKIIEEGLDKRSCKWQKIDASSAPTFPRLSEEDIRNITVGVYQLKLAPCYTREHLDDDGNYEVFTCDHEENLLCAKIQSRHISSKRYRVWVKYDDISVVGWYCQCKAGSRVVGTCSHVTALIWYLGIGKYTDNIFENCRDWSKYLLDARNLPDPVTVDESDNEEANDEEYVSVAIATRDSTVAKLLFSEVFKAIFNKMDEVKPEREIQESIKQINSSIDTILSSSTNYFPPFISCVLDILFELRNKLTVDVSNISSCAVISNIQPLGIVVLEDQLIVQGGDEARSSKRGRNDGLTVSRDIATWIELARLYKSVDEFDVLLGIFTNKLGTKEITKKAVEAESRCDYHKARTYYEEALDKDWSGEKPLDAELDLWDDCRMKCLNNLTQWKELQNVTDLAVEEGNIAKVWDDTFYQEHYLPYIMRSKVKLMLQGDEDQQTLLDFVDGAMRNPEQKSLLESRYCEYLALMYAWQQDYDRARHYSKMAQDKFLQEWCSTDVLIVSSRASRLQVLQPLVELQEFLEFMSVESNFNSNVPSTQLLAKWERRNPHVILDSIDTWDDIVTNRNVYLDHISQKLISCKTEDSMETDDGDIFLSSKVKLKLLMAESSTTQNNYKLSLNILAETRRQCKELDGINMLLWSHLYTLTHQKKAQNTEWSDDVFNSILSTGDLLGKYEKSGLLKEHAGLGRRHFVLTGQSHKLLASAVSNLNDLRDLNDKNQHKLKELTGKSKPSEITEVLVHNGYEQIKKSLSFDGTSTLDCSYGMDQAYLMTAKYCDTFLRLEEDDEMSLSGTDTDTFTSTVIVCLLNAMKLDCKEARQRFPRLLQLVEMNPNTVEKFKEKCAELPCWMFIMWIGQMVALLDKPEAKAIHNIIIDIAKTYPQAVTYPFKLSGEGYTFGNTSEDKENKAVKQKIEELLNDSLVSKFVSALEQFSQPDQLFKDWSEDIKLLIKKKEKDKIKAEFAKMYKLIFDHSMTSSARQSVDSSQGLSQVSQASIVETGNYIKKFGAVSIKNLKKDVEKVFGKDGQKIGSMSLKEFQINFSKLYTEMDEEVKGINKKKELIPPRSLVDYCEWMADFSGSTQGRRLEIPGQYNGESKPMPEYHVKVVGFDPRILVMSSIRKPKRLTIRGNDEKDYNYLVKGGEDLRQDQRIEQLFHLMNQVFVNNPACRHRKLHVKTYQVIPMTSRVGLIEWVKNTIPLKEFLRGSLTERENIDDRKTGPLILHVDWLKKLTKENQIVQYCQMYLRYNKTETIREFKNKESRIPWDLMRRSFRQMSTSPEAFHVLRVNCTVSKCHMALGDRHLSNSMVDLSTGQMVGIDFGHAFGSATQFLPIPELMPFRLTRQIRNLMMPLQEKGLMESTMIHTLRALREDYDLLLNTMDIFIKEPSLDWQINAEKQKQAMGEDSIEAVEETEEDRSWFSKQKVQYALRKMKGHNPRTITRDELKLGEKRHIHFSKALKSFENVALGDPKDNIRSQLPDKGLSVEQQVAALIDQATDPNILGRTYAGWEPWM
ncbi:PRKDC [Mytilus edulis]|uniref:DNA-dependent protein kinase catalytic subunit n=1 Tax=Mytilus edulis TaxID=6550 RepID=A0A8S3V2T5_MYTED|nr:PRKDC [Mytilus edulis]